MGGAAVDSLSTWLDVFYPVLQPGSQPCEQRVVGRRCATETPGQMLRRVRGGGAVEGDGGTPEHNERPIGQWGGSCDGQRDIFWTT